jgi:cytochrome c556
MSHPLKMRYGLAFALALTMAPLAMPTAQQPPAAQPTQPPPPAQPAQPPPPAQPATPAAPAAPGAPTAPAAPAAPPKVLVPVATNTLTANPDAFYGQAVTVTASVEQVLSKTAFVVDQRRVGTATLKGGPTDVLVLVPNIQSPVDLKSYVTVMGEVVKFDPAEVAKKAKDYQLDLPADALSKYTGRPAVIATSVINDKFIDVAKRLPPPMNAEEEAFSKVMKQVAPAFAALRAGIDSSNVENTTKNAATLKQAFTETETFFKPKKPDATLWAAEARKHVETIQASVAAGKWDEAKTTAGTLQQSCGKCHGQYRERFDDGSYRYKPGR